MFLKKMVPHTLFGRFLLIILVPAVLVQLFTIYMFYERHWSSISRNMSSSLAGEIAIIATSLQDSSKDERKKIIRVADKYMHLKVKYIESKDTQGTQSYEHAFSEDEYELLAMDLKRHISNSFSISTTPDLDFMVTIEVPNGWLEIEVPRKRIASSTTYIFIMWMTGSSAVLLLVAIFFLRNQVRTITRLAVAADKFGKGQDIKNFHPRGAKEVRRAAYAFIEMKERIKRLLNQRTEMLAGVSHDLKTPLTRMKLELSFLEKNEKTEALNKDIDEMEKMIKAYLDFARGSTSEETSKVRLSIFLNDILDSHPHEKHRLCLNVKNEYNMRIRYGSMKRCLNNLISNALLHASQVKLSTYVDGKYVVINVDDDGPGIPKEYREDVFRPFFRIDSSRNSETGGVGLGLAIVRDTVHEHGGQISLSESDMGGLRVTIKLPV